ncbi:hypothetical protein BAUCODRAFT_144175 [Baudoinia panamericana UAMH 10762]|uniref:Zn(2)-C6 fungal-type domain-containing protein n=1 Tax=Baudoinia panamericana (strain UAMH 10762) TaxID=717646 RepID=M2N8R1_BAUPA|nr:uncharacterized protein BAUCODRAFT_144175 [Baudoinia panamericana UAMH 10762]EMD00514.1 hypothetical protein BAUCODRAFT_144175 [Baudoinia panamericana UAMH 10762]
MAQHASASRSTTATNVANASLSHRATGDDEAGYKRAYKACEACRKHKARCETTSDASECTRCRRERRPCVFPLERSNKRVKTTDGEQREGTASTRSTAESTSFEAFSGRPLAGKAPSPRYLHDHHASEKAAATNAILPNLTIDRYNRGVNDASNDNLAATFPDQSAAERESASYLPRAPSTACAVPSDPSSSLHNDVVRTTLVTSSSDAVGLLFSAAVHPDSSDPEDDGQPERHTRQQRSEDTSTQANSELHLPGHLQPDTLLLWEKLRFVRQGWFTAPEAVSYLEFFFKHLAPLTPITDTLSADQDTHKLLILHEPLLCCTILMIASRQCDLPGSAGATRSTFIHARLWRHIEHLVQRITFGSEKYSTAKTRTLGSIQALLLIIEWHPRLLHFPPENDGWDAGLAPDMDDSFEPQDRRSDASRRWREEVFEPAKRSDRLSWMLVGLAITLAHELGVFDSSDDPPSTSTQIEIHRQKRRIRKLLYFYSTQLSLRLGCTNVYPQGDHSSFSSSPPTTSSVQEQAAYDRERLLASWIDITRLLSTATQMISSKPTTKRMLRSGQYVNLLEHYQPLLAKWHSDFMSVELPMVASAAKDIVLVEYYFTRVYVNSLALQALIERTSGGMSGSSWLDQDLFRKEYKQDFRFINDVRESSGHILVTAKKLSDEGVLQYSPVRFFLRLVAASIYLVKTLSLGTREADATNSLRQLEACVEALAKNRADDVHLSSRYAELMARHLRKIQRNLRLSSNDRLTVPKRFDRRPWQDATQGQPSLDNADGAVQTGQRYYGASSRDEGQSSATGHPDISFFPAGSEADAMWDGWLAQPFNVSIAPFDVEMFEPNASLTSESLDFLWNMPQLSEGL